MGEPSFLWFGVGAGFRVTSAGIKVTSGEFRVTFSEFQITFLADPDFRVTFSIFQVTFRPISGHLRAISGHIHIRVRVIHNNQPLTPIPSAFFLQKLNKQVHTLQRIISNPSQIFILIITITFRNALQHKIPGLCHDLGTL